MLTVVVVGLLAGCSGGGIGGDDGAGATCDLIERLAKTADDLETADLRDPDAFEAALAAASAEYVETVDALLDVAPDALRPDLQRMKAAVQQERYDDAIDARAAIDDYGRRTCGFEATSTTTATASTTLPDSTTTTPAPAG